MKNLKLKQIILYSSIAFFAVSLGYFVFVFGGKPETANSVIRQNPSASSLSQNLEFSSNQVSAFNQYSFESSTSNSSESDSSQNNSQTSTYSNQATTANSNSVGSTTSQTQASTSQPKVASSSAYSENVATNRGNLDFLDAYMR